jgi:hypothetical protein
MLEKLKSYVKTHRAESVVSMFVIVALIGAGGFLLFPKLSKIKFTNPFPQAKIVKTQVTPVPQEETIQQKNAAIVAEASDQIALPKNEEPIFATVSDSTKLQNQDFFKQAQDGDKILLYPKNKKAFLYRPSIKQVIAVAPLDYQPDSSDASVAAATIAPTSVGPAPTIKPQGKVLYNNQQ